MNVNKVKLAILVTILMTLAAFGLSCTGDSASSSESKVDSQQAEAAVSKSDTLSPDMADWCAEHRVPESECTLCHPALIAKFKATGDWCGPHNLPESHCRICNPELVFPQEKTLLESTPQNDSGMGISIFFPENSPNCATDGALIQFANVQTVERAGLTVQPVLSAALSATVEAPAEIIFDETKTTVVTSSVPALVVRWLAQPGQFVKSGEVLAELESPEMPELQGEFLEAAAQSRVQQLELGRNQELLKKELISQATYETALASAQVAQAELAKAEGLLRAAGVSESELKRMADEKSVSPRYRLNAPISGRLMRRDAKPGELLSAGSPLALLSDPRSLWIEAKVREQDAKRVKVGQEIEFLPDASGERRFRGRIIWANSYLDQETRTATVRGKILSSSDRINPGEFGRAVIHTGRTDVLAVLVPKDAVQWEGCCNVVFVKESQDRYHPRKVNIDTGEAGYYRVTEGIKPGEEVVVQGSYLLKTELRKTSIGAGCCGLEAGA